MFCLTIFSYTRKLVLVPLSLVSVFHECLKAGIRTQIFLGLYLSVNVFSTKVQIGDNLCSLVCWELNMHFFCYFTERVCVFRRLWRLQSRREVQGLTLQSFLVLPMQRITRLPLLVNVSILNIEFQISSSLPGIPHCRNDETEPG